MSEHIAKRQRLTGSFSPASPPYHLASTTNETKAPIQPNTPTSPPYSSMNSQPHGGFTFSDYTGLSDMTPPSSVHASQYISHSERPMRIPQAFPASANPPNTSPTLGTDSDGDAMMADSQENDDLRLGGHRRSNHNRQEFGHVAKGVYGSQLFKPCQSTYKPSKPACSQNLFELYGLNDLASSVARLDPVTGEKINKLRKSYEGHIKTLQIAGKPKATKLEGALSMLVNWPDEEYHSQKVLGKQMDSAVIGDQKSLSTAFGDLVNGAIGGMDKGSLPSGEESKFRSYIGTDDTIKNKSATEAPPARVPLPTSASSQPPMPSSAAATRALRPERSGSKRTYTDRSFAGYGEGYVDDYAESTGGEDNVQGSMKRRKLAFDRSHPQSHHPLEVGGVRR